MSEHWYGVPRAQGTYMGRRSTRARRLFRNTKLLVPLPGYWCSGAAGTESPKADRLFRPYHTCVRTVLSFPRHLSNHCHTGQGNCCELAKEDSHQESPTQQPNPSQDRRYQRASNESVAAAAVADTYSLAKDLRRDKASGG